MVQGTYKDSTITALGHDGFIVEVGEAKLRFAFDPFEITGNYEPVDYVFISHKHFDHCDPASIKKLLKSGGKVIAPTTCEEELNQFGDQLDLINDHEKHELNSLTYWTIPAYNTNKFRTPGEVFHPKELGGVGYVVEVGKTRFYHAGDTDITDEMASLKKIDIAFLPISGRFVMTLDEAIQAAELIKPDVVIPMHFGVVLGSNSDAYQFQNQLKDRVNVMVLTTE